MLRLRMIARKYERIIQMCIIKRFAFLWSGHRAEFVECRTLMQLSVGSVLNRFKMLNAFWLGRCDLMHLIHGAERTVPRTPMYQILTHGARTH